jgi:hypothetical protein
MSDKASLELIGIIEKQVSMSDSIFSAIGQAFDRDAPMLGRSGNAAVMVAGLLENYYTCLETAFLRISQHFENNLGEARWHSNLLEKMTIRIEGVRIPAISEGNYGNLLELLKFRHFRRYYFEMEYDWDRLDFLAKKLKLAHPAAKADFARFVSFLKSL